VLDVATGRGEPAVRAAARVAPDGFVLGTDRSAEMLAFASARAAREGVSNLRLEVADAQVLDGVPRGGFDVAMCRWGLMYLDEPRRALEAIRRSLVPGGVLVLAVWAEPSLVDWWSMPRDVLRRVAPEVVAPPVGSDVAGVFRWADAAHVRAELAAGGFQVMAEEEMRTAVMEAVAPEGLVAWCRAFGLSRLLETLPSSVADAWEGAMREAAAAFRDGDGCYRLGGVTRLVVAR
jgi:ubiquinone/menaquinone biosynthesis C-methylase UbiE